MENNYYKDDFEQMLRDSTEEFRMYPSRKVWHSIYNDLHPDRKWPSFAVSLLLLTAILYVGVTNNNHISKRTVALLTAKAVTNVPVALNAVAAGGTRVNAENTTPGKAPVIKLTIARSEGDSLHQLLAGLDAPVANQDAFMITDADKHVANAGITDDDVAPAKPAIISEVVVSSNTSDVTPAVHGQHEYTDGTPTEDTRNYSIASVPANNLVQTATQTQAGQLSENSLSPGEKAWMEDYAFHNVRNPNKWKTNLSFQYYVTPSIGYRHLNKHPGVDALSNSFVVTTDNDEVTQQAAPNLEVGGVMILGIGKKLKVKSGVQLNLTNYITYAHDLKHPTQTNVPMNESGHQYQQAYSTTFGNVLGSNYTKLNNSTVQLSIPIAVDYRVAGTNKVKWYMGAGIQPTYVLGGNAYLISSDNKNFAQDDAMLRKWNASANLETFVSIKAPSGVDINLGPQLRYQLFSTYSSKYSYTEKLYSLGIKIGVTKKL